LSSVKNFLFSLMLRRASSIIFLSASA
jgi:hypothetical protein